MEHPAMVTWDPETPWLNTSPSPLLCRTSPSGSRGDPYDRLLLASGVFFPAMKSQGRVVFVWTHAALGKNSR